MPCGCGLHADRSRARLEPLSGYGQPLLLDNSAWARALDNRLSGTHRRTFDEALGLAGIGTMRSVFKPR
jgi:hypothetical protein